MNNVWPPTLLDVTKDLVESGVIVDTIHYTSSADPAIQAVSDETGGLYFYDPGQQQNTDMVLGLLQILHVAHVECNSVGSATVSEI